MGLCSTVEYGRSQCIACRLSVSNRNTTTSTASKTPDFVN